MVRRDLIGQILVDLAYVARGQLDETLRRQSAEPGRKLGEILVAMKVLTPELLEEGLALQEWVKRLEGKEN